MTPHYERDRCFAFHEEWRVWCALAPGHKGAHGWDYEAGEPAVITLKQMEAKYDDAGLGQLAERLRWFVETMT